MTYDLRAAIIMERLTEKEKGRFMLIKQMIKMMETLIMLGYFIKVISLVKQCQVFGEFKHFQSNNTRQR